MPYPPLKITASTAAFSAMPNGLSFDVAPVGAGAAPVLLLLLLPAQDARVPTRGPVSATARAPRMNLRRSKALFSVLISCSNLSGVVVRRAGGAGRRTGPRGGGCARRRRG